MREAIARELRHIVYTVAIVAAVFVWGYVELHRPPSPASSVAPTASPDSRIDRIEREVQGVVDADRVLAASRGGVPQIAAPAVTVLRDIPGLSGFSPAQVAQILSGLKAPTREVVGAKLVVPTPSSAPTAPPGWTDAQIQAIIAADKVATESVINDPQTHIPVTVSREEVAPTRIGSMLTPAGSGLGYAAVRRGHFEIDLGAIVRGAHLSPALSPAYLIPHTAVACGPFVGYDQHALYGAACTVHF